MGSKRGYSFLKGNFTRPQSCFQVVAVKTQNTTSAVTQLSHWHGAPCSVGEEKDLLKAQQQILIRTYTPTYEHKKGNLGIRLVDPMFLTVNH